MENLIAKVWELLTIYGLKVIAAVVVFVVGRWIAKGLTKFTKTIMNKKKVDLTIASFVANMVYITLLVFVVMAALGQLGIQTTSFIAIIGAAGLAVGLALQGSLSNFAAGFLMIIFRPFKIGDYIEGAGVGGTVEAVQLFTTQIQTPDNRTIIIPNSALTAGNIINWSVKETRRVDLVMGIGYENDIDKARTIMDDILSKDERILKAPAPTIAVMELADSSINFVVRPWVKPEHYWDVYFDTTEKIKKGFDAQGISIPFPQRDVHLYEHKQ